MSAQRELKTDRMASIKDCKAERGPLNCRYHSGVINDCFVNLRKNSLENNTNSESYRLCVQQLQDNINQLLNIYTYENNRKRFEKNGVPFTNTKGNSIDEDKLFQLRESLEHINKALKYGDYNGKTLETCVDEFNKLIGVPLERITSSDEKIFYNRSVRGTLENNSLIQQLLPNLIEEINTDGSLNLNKLVPLEQQQEAVTFFKGVLSNQLFEVSKLKTAYIDFRNDLELLYPPMIPFDPLEMRMNKQDVKEYWGYITKKHPILEENYYSVMNKTAPETVQDLQTFKDAIIYQPSALITQENAIRSMKRYGLLTPAGTYLATKLYPKYTNNVKMSQQNQQSDTDIQLADSILTKVIEGHSPDSGSLTLQRLKALSINWDAYKILDTITDPKTGSPLQQEYQAALETTKRIIYPDGSIQYDIL